MMSTNFSKFFYNIYQYYLYYYLFFSVYYNKIIMFFCQNFGYQMWKYCDSVIYMFFGIDLIIKVSMVCVMVVYFWDPNGHMVVYF